MEAPTVLPPKNTNVLMGEIYIKNASYEIANTPYIFRKKKENPTIDSKYYIDITEIEPDWFEVALTLTVNTKFGDDMAYIVEAVQAGIFHFNQMEETEKNQLLSSYCPRLLFPYARETISSLIQKGGFLQIAQPPIEFDVNFKPEIRNHSSNA